VVAAGGLEGEDPQENGDGVATIRLVCWLIPFSCSLLFLGSLASAGLVAGSIGGTLIVIGAILELVSILIKSAPK
jgi:hypothetical protein